MAGMKHWTALGIFGVFKILLVSVVVDEPVIVPRFVLMVVGTAVVVVVPEPGIIAVPVILPVTVSVTGELKACEQDAGRDQEAPDDGALRVLDQAPELQSNDDDDAAQQQREGDVGKSGQPGQACDTADRVAPRAP